MTGIPARVIRSNEEVRRLRDEKAEQEAAQQEMQQQMMQAETAQKVAPLIKAAGAVD